MIKLNILDKEDEDRKTVFDEYCQVPCLRKAPCFKTVFRPGMRTWWPWSSHHPCKNLWRKQKLFSEEKKNKNNLLVQLLYMSKMDKTKIQFISYFYNFLCTHLPLIFNEVLTGFVIGLVLS